MRYETFPPLAAYRHAFTLRDPDDDTRSDDFARRFAQSLGYPHHAAAEQPHGNGVAIVDCPGLYPGVDALITRQRGLPLIIRCADCAPVFLIDRRTPAIALIHSGKKGTLADVVGEALKHIRADLALIGPCIGPCHYELDLWTEIERQLPGLEVHNVRCCTACHLDRYYSYRAERGQTGRMFALLAL